MFINHLSIKHSIISLSCFVPLCKTSNSIINSLSLGAWDPNIRIEPPKVVPDQAKRLSHFQTPNGHAEGIDDEDGGGGGHNGEHEGLERTGK